MLFSHIPSQANISFIILLNRVLAYSGLRKGELRCYNGLMLNFKEMFLDVNKAVKLSKQKGEHIGPTKNDSSTRLISLDVKTLKVLRKWRLEQKKYFFKCGISMKDDQFVFPNKNNTSFMYRDHLINVMKKYPGKRITPHEFRHTHATLALDAGIQPKDVQARLGHANSSTTMDIYAHVANNGKRLTQTFVSYLEN